MLDDDQREEEQHLFHCKEKPVDRADDEKNDLNE